LTGVEILKISIDFSQKVLQILNPNVGPVFSISSIDEIAKDDSLSDIDLLLG
jgi:hypothetical protein